MTDSRLPPHNLDAEESVLGAAMLSGHIIDPCLEVLRPGDWYRQSHQTIWDAIVSLHGQGLPTDAIAVVNRLTETGMLEAANGAARVHELAALVPAAGNAPHYARIIRELAGFRDLIRVGTETARRGWDRTGALSEALDASEQEMFALGQTNHQHAMTTIGDGLHETWGRLEELSRTGRRITGVPSGFEDIDRLTAGFQAGNLVIVAARPGVGKTSWALAVASHVTMKEKKPVGLFTLEMSKEEIQQRLMAMTGRVNLLKLRNGTLGAEEWQRLSGVASKIADAPLYVDDTASVTMLDIRSKARKLLTRQRDTALIIVDYVQLMVSAGKSENRNQELSQISRGLKLLAGELGVPVLALSQLSRDVEKRHDKRPMLADLRDSGSLEQDASLVVFLYRDAYYHPEDAMEDGTERICEVNLAKHRNGPTDTVQISWDGEHTLFGNLAPSWRS